MITIYFDTLPSCGACRLVKPRIEAAANEAGAQFIERNTRAEHGSNSTVLPTIYIQKDNEQPVTLMNAPTKDEMIILINQLKNGNGNGNGNTNGNGRPDDKPDTQPQQKKILKVTGAILLILITIFILRKKKVINIKM